MKRFRTILACTDLTKESFTAVEYAAALAKADGSRLVVLHVPQNTHLLLADLVPTAELLALDRKVEKASLARLQEWIEQNVPSSVRARAFVRCGVTHEVILRAAAELPASVVVMATHGRKGIGHLLIGSITERVLREAPCPVLAIRPSMKTSRKARRPPAAAARRRTRTHASAARAAPISPRH